MNIQKPVLKSNDNSTLTNHIPLHVLLIIYLFLVVRLIPDLLAINFLWQGVFVIYTLITLNYIFTKKLKLLSFFSKWYFSFFLIALSSYFWAFDNGAVLAEINTFIVILIGFTLLTSVISSFYDIYNIIYIIVLAIFTFFIYILIKADWSTLGKFRLGVDTLGGSWNANSVGILLAFGIFLSLIITKTIFKNKFSFISIFMRISIPLFVVLILLTGSRKALLVLIVDILIWGFLYKGLKTYLIFIFSLLLIGILYLLVLNVPAFYEVLGIRIENIFTSDYAEGSYLIRQELILSGIEWYSNKPFFGYGIGNYASLSPYSVYAHNNYIELLVDLGIVGTVAFYYPFFYSLLSTHQMKIKLGFYMFLINIFVIVMLLVLGYGSVIYNDFFYMLLVAIALRITELSKGVKKIHE